MTKKVTAATVVAGPPAGRGGDRGAGPRRKTLLTVRGRGFGRRRNRGRCESPRSRGRRRRGVRPSRRGTPRRPRRRGPSSARRAARPVPAPRADARGRTRRRWPADRKRAGTSASAVRPNAASGRADAAFVAAVQAGPERDVLRHGQQRLHGVEVADVTERAVPRLAVVAHLPPAPGERSRGPRREPGEQAQEARLAAAVGAAQHQRAALADAEVETGEHQPLAALASQSVAGQLGDVRRSDRPHGQSGRTMSNTVSTRA